VDNVPPAAGSARRPLWPRTRDQGWPAPISEDRRREAPDLL